MNGILGAGEHQLQPLTLLFICLPCISCCAVIQSARKIRPEKPSSENAEIYFYLKKMLKFRPLENTPKSVDTSPMLRATRAKIATSPQIWGIFEGAKFGHFLGIRISVCVLTTEAIRKHMNT